MRLLFQSDDPSELAKVSEMLEQKGIPVFISSEETYRIRRSAVFFKKGLWVCLDEQYSDAARLLENPAHKVAKPADVDAFYRSLEKAQGEPLRGIWQNRDKILNVVVIIVVLLGIAAMAVLLHRSW